MAVIRYPFFPFCMLYMLYFSLCRYIFNCKFIRTVTRVKFKDMITGSRVGVVRYMYEAYIDG